MWTGFVQFRLTYLDVLMLDLLQCLQIQKQLGFLERETETVSTDLERTTLRLSTTSHFLLPLCLSCLPSPSPPSSALSPPCLTSDGGLLIALWLCACNRRQGYSRDCPSPQSPWTLPALHSSQTQKVFKHTLQCCTSTVPTQSTHTHSIQVAIKQTHHHMTS